MNTLRLVSIVTAALLAVAGCQQQSASTAADKSEIQDGTRAWAVAYNDGNADGVANLYADDAVVMPPGTPPLFGRAAIREYIVGDSAAAKAAGLMLTIEHGDSVGISGDLAWHTGPYSVSDASGARVDGGNYMEALQKQDGKWHIVRDIWNSDKAPAPDAAPAGDPAS